MPWTHRQARTSAIWSSRNGVHRLRSSLVFDAAILCDGLTGSRETLAFEDVTQVYDSVSLNDLEHQQIRALTAIARGARYFDALHAQSRVDMPVHSTRNSVEERRPAAPALSEDA